MIQQGWIKLHREILHHWIFQDAEYLKAWVVILMEVNHSPGERIIKKRLIKYDRGESLKSLETWGTLFGGWGKKKVHRFFDTLKKEGMIDTESVTVTTRLKVLNYSKYQNTGHDIDTHATLQRKRTGTTDKNDKNVKNEKKKHNGTSLEFDAFWSVYPKKVGKKAAVKAWRAAKDKPPIHDLVAIVRQQRTCEAWQKDGGQYVPNPATWLNQGRWDDEPQQPGKQQQQGKTLQQLN
jgi:hypothetical protein